MKTEIPITEMTLRDHFAAAALQGLLTGDKHLDEWETEHQMCCDSMLAANAYSLADEMMKKRGRNNPPICKRRDKCQPTAEYALWMAECHETNHDEDGKCVGESWPGYVTFEEWRTRRRDA